MDQQLNLYSASIDADNELSRTASEVTRTLSTGERAKLLFLSRCQTGGTDISMHHSGQQTYRDHIFDSAPSFDR